MKKHPLRASCWCKRCKAIVTHHGICDTKELHRAAEYGTFILDDITLGWSSLARSSSYKHGISTMIESGMVKSIKQLNAGYRVRKKGWAIQVQQLGDAEEQGSMYLKNIIQHTSKQSCQFHPVVPPGSASNEPRPCGMAEPKRPRRDQVTGRGQRMVAGVNHVTRLSVLQSTG